MTPNTHTPTPWCYRKAAKHLHVEGTHVGYGRRIATVPYVGDSTGWTSAANAAHIVHCVNNHDALVAALREVARWDGVSGIDAEWPRVMEIVHAALAMAEKGA